MSGAPAAAERLRHARGERGPRRVRAILMLLLATTLAVTPVQAQHNHKGGKPPVVLPPSSPPASPAPPPETKPYDGQLMRLSEILGALSYLGTLCDDANAQQWRTQMQTLLEAEGTLPVRKDRLAGAYNRGIQGYSLSYRTCTPNARFVIERFLEEGARIAKDVENRYRAS